MSRVFFVARLEATERGVFVRPEAMGTEMQIRKHAPMWSEESRKKLVVYAAKLEDMWGVDHSPLMLGSLETVFGTLPQHDPRRRGGARRR